MPGGLRDWLGRMFGPPDAVRPEGAGRRRWEPRGGVSSFHLWWQGLEGGPAYVAVTATIEVLQRPRADRLYFWALQASFLDGRRAHGAAHIGPQWNPRHAGSTAVNWGGYADTGNVQSILTGTASALPSTPDDPNTRDFPWREGVAYRLRISRDAPGWRGEITDASTGAPTLIRHLHAGGDRLGGFVVWAEVFAACDDPPTAVRWSDFEAYDANGVGYRPASVRLSFPDGGDCPNTDVVVDGVGLVQHTNARRSVRPGTVLPVPRPS